MGGIMRWDVGDRKSETSKILEGQFFLDFFLWVELLMEISGRVRRRRDVDDGKRVEPQYNFLTNRTMNNSPTKRII